ncbi:MAG: AmmeMemoRadiSam system radical SAM enzyme [Candidatus Hodarchaeales archaeon]
MQNHLKKESYLYSPLKDSSVKCLTCWRQCNILDGSYGFCRTRINIKGVLYCINHGLISSLSVNPIEKKPLFHYFPGTFALTAGSYSCNFTCPWCQNHDISKVYPADIEEPRYLPVEELVKQAEANPQVDGLSISFNEPVLSLEYAVDTFRLSNEHLYKMIVTNGYMTDLAFELLIDSGMTGMSVNVKGDAATVKKFCNADVNRVWKNIRTAHGKGVHVEIICLIIPGVNDEERFFKQVARDIVAIDERIPLHFTRYFPAYRFTADPTPVSLLEKACEIASQEGVKFVYIGNVPGHQFENTYCPFCRQLLIKRTGFQIELMFETITSHCPSCGAEIPIYTFNDLND